MKNPSISFYFDTLRLAGLASLLATAALSGCGGGGGGGGGSSPGSAAPTAAPSSVSTVEDVPTSGTLSASDPNGDPLTYSIDTPPNMGTAVITDATIGSFTYTPDPDKNGTDNFTFKASDGSAASPPATVTVTIDPQNDAPVSHAGTLVTNEDTPANGTLTASDTDGDPLTFSIASAPSGGAAVITDSSTGTFTYTPDPERSGSDSFTFVATDGSASSEIATVSVTVNPVNDPPVTVGGCSTTPQAQTLVGTLNASDAETPAFLTYRLNADGSGGVGAIVTAKGGTVTITDQRTGAFEYQPNATAGDNRGVDSFEYQVSDIDGGVSSATETVIVDQKIMPLGDSITQGSLWTGTAFEAPEVRVGYRKPLFDALITWSYKVDFVGSLSNGWTVLSDSEHEGHGGWTASEIAWGRTGFPTDGVQAWLNGNPADIVLLHAGTNGLDPNGDIDVEAILDEIDNWENSADGNPVTVILALIIDQDPINPDVTAFNDNLLTMANSRITAGDDVIVVDQQGALIYPNDLSDSLHPNESGYAKMANVWLDALTADNPNTKEAVLDKCP